MSLKALEARKVTDAIRRFLGDFLLRTALALDIVDGYQIAQTLVLRVMHCLRAPDRDLNVVSEVVSEAMVRRYAILHDVFLELLHGARRGNARATGFDKRAECDARLVIRFAGDYLASGACSSASNLWKHS